MPTTSKPYDLSEEELRELIPQLQQLTEKYKRAERLQKALFDISELSSSISNLPNLYPAIHEIIADLMYAENFYVAFYNKEENVIDFSYFVDEHDERVVGKISEEELKGGITHLILRTGKEVFFERDKKDDFCKQHKVKLIGSHSHQLLGVPLKRGNQVIGAMVAQAYDESVTYHHQDLEFLLFVSQHIVNTVDRVKSRELTENKIRERTRQLRKTNDELQEEIHERQKVESLQNALFEISELAATLEGDMLHFYKHLHEILARLINAPNCYIALLTSDNNHLEFPYFSDETSSTPKNRDLGRGLTELVLRSGQAELVNTSRVLSLAELGEIDVSVAQSMLENANSWLGAPLFIEGEIAGVIAVQTYGKFVKYDIKDLELLRFVSHHIAVAMERKRSRSAIQSYNLQLEQRVQARTDELDKANKFLKHQIEVRKEIELKLIHDAHHDNLTGLPNRTMFTSRLELALASKKRYSKNLFAVLFVDLDRFKVINDTLGHHAGDEFLIEVANRISLCIRGHDLLARLGGDEFVLLLDNFEDEVDVEDVASRIIKSIAKPFTLDGKDMYSGASIGIAHIETSYQSADEVLRDADAAMYQAKSLGRGRFVMFDKSMRAKLLEELELENEFRSALKDKSFNCYLQPVFHLNRNQEIYQELYIRWVHPTLGKIPREQFRQVAEHSGLTIEFDFYQVSQACALIAERATNSIGKESIKIAINLSINHLMQNSMVKQLIDYIKGFGVNLDAFVFEFDENELNQSSQYVLPAIKKLKREGATLVLDNFGSGLASLSYLFSYPFDFVKIDHRFIKSLPRSQKNLKLVQSVMLVAENQNFEVIAEGVNGNAQYEALKNIGCIYAQGTYFSQATSLDEITISKVG